MGKICYNNYSNTVGYTSCSLILQSLQVQAKQSFVFYVIFMPKLSEIFAKIESSQ